MSRYHFWPREAGPGDPGGTTVSKAPQLPAGDFTITSYTWGPIVGRYPPELSLWFIDADNFTEAEREAAFRQFTGIETTWQKKRRNRRG